VGFTANPRFRRLFESEIPAFEVERLPECAGRLEESTVDQGMKGQMVGEDKDAPGDGPSSSEPSGLVASAPALCHAGMTMYSFKAVMCGKAGDVFEMIGENFI
jgi:hypothetical protein